MTAPRSSTPMGTVGTSSAASASRKMNNPYASTAIGPRPRKTRASSSTAWRTPAQITIESADVRTPRALARYSASASRNSGLPRASPIRRASVGAEDSALRVEAAHSVRGNSDTSGEPGIRLWTGAARTPRGRGGAWAPLVLSTQVPAP